MTRQRRGPSTALVAFVLMAVGASVADPAGAAGGAALPGAAVRLAGAPSLPRGASVVGPTNRTETITADVSLAPRDLTALHEFVAAVSTPGSPQFHHYLGPGQFASTFGPTTAAIDSVRAWLSSAGLHVGRTTPDGLLVPVTGTAGQLAGTFGVSLVDTRLPDGHVARFSENAPSVPASVAPLVQGVVGLSTVGQPQPQIVAPPLSAAPTVPAPAAVPHAGPTPCSQATQTGGYTADQLAATYGLSSLYGIGRTGAGQTIGLYELERFTPSDIAAYQSCYGLTNSITNLLVDGGPSDPRQQGEAALDIEDAAGLAPGAAIKVYSGPPDGTGPIDTYSAMVNDPSLKVISTSWGLCEPEMAAQPGQQVAEAFLFAEAAANGQTVVAASGDSGSTDCYAPGNSNTSVSVDDPADQPDVTGVGGTTLLRPGSPPAETVWNNFTGSGGGGVSSDFAMPAWQVGPGVDSPLAASRCAAIGRSSCREVPDISASSDPLHGYAVIFKGNWQMIGGTSGAAPLVGAMTAVIDQGLGSTAGLINPVLYGAGSCSASPFSDVTNGSNALLPASGGLYPATANYDLASGWGSPSAPGLNLDLVLRPVCPVVTGVRPNKGVTSGGNSVVVTGFNLSGVTSVRFGPFSAPAFAVTSPESLTVRVPPGPVSGGSVVDVTLSNTGGSSRPVSSDHYVYTLPGYWLTASDGGIFTYGAAGFFGSSGAIHLNQPIVGMASTPDDRGYWLVASDGGIFTFGDAGFFGSTGAIRLNRPIVGMASTPGGGGYWLVASDGGIFTFGDAAFFGSTGAMRLNQPIVGMAPTLGGDGYWLVASDGGIFSFGDAAFHGSTGAMRLNQPIVGMAPTLGGNGYWLVASDGGIFSFGDAAFHGSTGAIRLNQPIVGMAPTLGGNGYWLVASDGGIFSFGDAGFYGSAGAIRLNRPVVGMAAT